MLRYIYSALALGIATAELFASDADNYLWNDDISWISARVQESDGFKVSTEADGSGWITGYMWSDSIGWIELSSGVTGPFTNGSVDNWGVNISTSGELSGYAWNEQIGWIKFSSENGNPTVSTTDGVFTGYAWNEQIGWISFENTNPMYQLATDAYPIDDSGSGSGEGGGDTQTPMGTPQEWLDFWGVTEYYDAGDGVYAWKKYIMDVPPVFPGNALQIHDHMFTPNGFELMTFVTSPYRIYTLQRRSDLVDGDWADVPGQVDVPGTGGPTFFLDANPSAPMFYRLVVEVPEGGI